MKCCVLLSSYNGEKYISEQIESILNQSVVDVFLVVRDDGSTDNTIEIINSYVEKNQNKIKLVSGSNVGIHKSFYKLIMECPESDYYAFSDQDDYWDKDKLLCAITALSNEGADFYSCASRLCDERLNPIDRNTSNAKQYAHYRKKDNCILTPGSQGCTIVITKALLQFLTDHNIPSYYGHDTWITIVAYYFFNSVYDDKPHMLYRQHNNSWTGNRTNRLKQLRREIGFFCSGLNRYSQLAGDILTRFEKDLAPESQKLLLVLSKKTKTFGEKAFLISNSHFRKYGFLRNIVFRVFIFLGKV